VAQQSKQRSLHFLKLESPMRGKNSQPIDILKIVTDHAQKVLRTKIRALISEKLATLDISPPDAALDELVEQLFSGQPPAVQWDDEKDKTRTETIVFSEAEVADLEAAVSKLIDGLPLAIENASDEVAKSLLRTLIRRWPTEQAWELAERLGFQERLEERWGEPFGLLRMLIAIVREMGGDHAKRLRRSRSKKTLP
jgi:hypothetical protein